MKNHIIPALFIFILLFASCNDIKKKTMDSSDAQLLLSEAVTAYDIFSNTQEESTRTGLQLNELSKSALVTATEYPIITVDPIDLTWPKTITVDFGPENITGIDGRLRRGVMIIVAQDFPNVDNATWETSFDGFYLDDYLVEGIQDVKYTGSNSNGHPEYECTLTDGKITSPEGKSFLFEQHTTREWTNGYDTHYILSKNLDDLCDDDYQISGNHNGVSSDGYTYTMTTTEPLLVNVCCKYVEDGKLMVELQDAELNCEIDFRPGNDNGELCNNLASFIIFGNTVPIKL